MTPVISVGDRVARILYLILALSTLSVFVLQGLPEALGAGPDTLRVQWWRTLAYLVFAAVLVLLAARPRSLPGLWEAVVVQKAGIAIIGFVNGTAAEAYRSPVDLGVAIVMVVAWILSRGWMSWNRSVTPEPAHATGTP